MPRTSISPRFSWPLALLLFGGCAQVGLEGYRPRVDGGSDGSDAGAPHGDGAAPVDALPEVRITSPLTGTAINTAPLRIEGTSSDDFGVASVFVKVGPNIPQLAHTEDNFRHWWVESNFPNGMFTVEAEARDLRQQLSLKDSVMLIGPLSADDAAPTLQILTPEDGSTPLNSLVLVTGTAADDLAVVSMQVLRNGELLQERNVDTDNFFATWSRLVPLLPGEENVLTFIARDAAGHEGQATITLTGRAEIDREAPDFTVTSPANASMVSTALLTVTGTAGDEVGVREVKVRIGTPKDGTTEVVYSEYVSALSEDGFQTWHLDLPIKPGTMEIEARAIDLSGLATSVSVGVINTFQPAWTDEVAIPLRLRTYGPAPTLRFDLDREGVNEVIPPDVQKGIKVLELATTNLLTSAVDQLKLLCGDVWDGGQTNPAYNCANAGFPAPWRESAEFNFVRLLTMTPANAVVDGTSVAQLKSIAGLLNAPSFNAILAQVLAIPIEREIITTGSVVRALQSEWLQPHPYILPGAKIPVTLHDAMNDLTTLDSKLGAAGGHPGILDTTYDERSVVFGPNFRMVLVAKSNLRWFDGIDLSGDGIKSEKEYLAIVVDPTGNSNVLEFDFNDSQRFSIEGLVANPTLDLKMIVREHFETIPACGGDACESEPDCGGDACKTNTPQSPYLPNGTVPYVWSIDRWLSERIIAAAALDQYRTLTSYNTYQVRLLPFIRGAEISVTAGEDGLNGWAVFNTFADVGSPPPPQYIWELIHGIAQVRLHDRGGSTIPKGQANVAFTLKGVNVGMNADEIRAATRIQLSKPETKLSEKLLGDYKKNNGAVDFYYKRGADNKPYLFFAAASDPLPSGTYNYAQPGFFSDETLTTKASSAAAGTSGDTAHEKLELAAGESTFYIKDDLNQVYRLRFVVGEDPTEIRVYASKKVL